MDSIAPFNPPQPDVLEERAALCASDVRAWALQTGYANLAARIESSKATNAQASTTLAVLLAGIGGALAYAVKVFEPHATPVTWGAAALCAYFVALSGVLLQRCLSVGKAPMLYNSPKNLLIPDASLEEIQAGELANVQERIDQQRMINDERADWLNRVRRFAIASPAVFVIAAGAAMVVNG